MKKIIYNEDLAKNYNEFNKQEESYFADQLEKIYSKLSVNKDDKILDIGCGSGRLLKEFQNNLKFENNNFF